MSNSNTLQKYYEIHARLPMTIEARNAGATGRTHWWIFVGRVFGRNKKHACAKLRKSDAMPYAADKLRAYSL